MQVKKMSGNSKNPQEDLLNWLKTNLPEVFVEGKIDPEALKKTLGSVVNDENERYGLTWAGKSNCFRVIQEPTTATLKPVRDESVNFDETENVFIEGDNLEVLKVLQKPYYGKVKMIYIDPPYNTGNDFIYNDDFKRSRKEYLEEAGETDENGNLRSDGLMKNTRDRGHYHSDWLNMMYPRLFLARNLLKEDGVIFVSIDDNEVKNLRAIMDEIFGEENFLAQIVWQKIHSTKNDAKYFSDSHEYLLCYAKNKTASTIKLLPRTEKMDSRFTNQDNDERGPWSSGDLVANGERKDGYYDVEGPTGKLFNVPKGKHWVYSQPNMKRFIEEGRIWFGKNGDAFPRLKRYLSEVQQGKKADTLWQSNEVGHNQEATQELKALFEGVLYFDTPKPIRLIERCVELVLEKGDLCLDFFAGSATTAHAVMALNAKDGGSRKCISVQLPELCEENGEAYKSGYETIANIAKERIRRAGKQLLLEKKSDDLEGNLLDVGFKAFKMESSNFKIWESRIEDVQKLAEQMDIFVDNGKGKSNQEEVLYELIVKSGLDLNARVENKGQFYSINNGELVVCLADTLDEKLIDEILSEKPLKVLCLDSSFGGNDQLKTNTALQMESAGIELKVI